MLSLKGIIDLLNDKNRKCTDTIRRWRGVYFGMSLHIDGACPAYKSLSDGCWVYPTNYFGETYQWMFDNVLYSRHPRESEEQRTWRLSQHRPFTQEPFLKVIQMLSGAIFQDSGYSIDIKNPDDNAYIWGNNFDGKNLVGFLAEKFQDICVDPNGVFVVIPKKKPKDLAIDEKIQPKVVFIPSRYIEYRTEDEIVFAYDGLMWCANCYGLFRFRKNEESDEWVNIDGVYGSYYTHRLQRIPNHIAGGIWNSQGFYESWLHAGKSWADEFISSKSAEQLVNKEASHPTIVEPSEDCPVCEGLGQSSYCKSCDKHTDVCECETPEHRLTRCTTCGGKGTVSHNPGDRWAIPLKDIKEGGKFVEYITPEISVNEFHAKNNAAIFESLLRALFLNYIDKAQSALAKDRDMEARYQFVLSIANDFFDRLIPALLNDMLGMRNVSVVDGKLIPYVPEYIITKPTHFQIHTSYELLMEYEKATQAKVPAFMLAKQLNNYSDKQFGGDEVLKKKTWFITQKDPYALKDENAMETLLANNIITQQDWQFTLKLPILMDELVREKSQDWFIKADYDEISRWIDRKFAEKIGG